MEALPDTASIVVPLSGGGLFSGVAFAVKKIRDDINMNGVTMERGAAMHASLAAGRPVLVDEIETLADSLGGGIGLDNRYTFAMTQTLIDNVVLFNEASIARGIVFAYREERLVMEGAAAVGIAAILDGCIDVTRGPVVLVISGSNIDMNLHRRLIQEA
jgi:threonine dehydratase